MAQPRIAPYILAGGRSSRMGRDKAMITLGGMTMLERAVRTIRSVPSLGSAEVGARVTVVGDRTLLEGADRAISDRYPGCGPLGGIEAALEDIVESRTGEWALFMPVDMPFLPAGLIDALVCEWTAAGKQGARVCMVVIDGRPQPLVSMVHQELQPFLLKELLAGQFRVTPVLQSACNALASRYAGTIVSSRSVVWQTELMGGQVCESDQTWYATEMERQTRPLWFENVNTADELYKAETFLFNQGSTSNRDCFPH